MSKELTMQEHEIIQQLILDRWNPHRINQKIANHFDLSVNQVRHIRRKPQFQAEYDKQLALYKGSFDDICLADRKERVKALDGLYQRIPDVRVALKIKVLQAIREEVGDDRPVLEVHHSGHIGLNAPPRANTYEEWVEQNETMERGIVEASFKELPVAEAYGGESDPQKVRRWRSGTHRTYRGQASSRSGRS
jgi:hypothetical protein